MTKETLVIVVCFLLCVISYILGFLYSSNGLLYAGPVGIVALIVLHTKKQWREGLEGAKLSFGKNFRYYLIIPLILGGLLCASYILNY